MGRHFLGAAVIAATAIGGPALASGPDRATAVPLAGLMEQLMPSSSCWRARISESLRDTQVRVPQRHENWETTLQTVARVNGFKVDFDRMGCVVTLSTGGTTMAGNGAGGTGGAAARPATGGGGASSGRGDRFAPDAERPLGRIVSGLVPSTWTVRYQDGLNGSMKVVAEPGSTINTLNKTLRRNYGIEVAMDVDTREAVVRNMTAEDLESGPDAERGEPGAVLAQADEDADGPKRDSKEPQGTNMRRDGKVVTRYESLDDLLRETVTIDLQNVMLDQVLRALAPKGWEVEIRGVSDEKVRMRVDLTTEERRGIVLSGLMREAGLNYYPFLELNKIIVTSEK